MLVGTEPDGALMVRVFVMLPLMNCTLTCGATVFD